MGKKSQTTSAGRVYGNTTTSNPYVTATTNNGGTTSKFQNGTALESIYNFVNKNVNTLLDDYLNPNINSVTNQAKLKSFTDALSSQTAANLENDIINPLSRRNMIRSSQATDLYKNLSNRNAASIDDYITDLISQAQDNSAKMLLNLLSMYGQGYDILSDVQKQSLQTSGGNATGSNTASSGAVGTDALSTALTLASFL